MTSENSALLS